MSSTRVQFRHHPPRKKVRSTSPGTKGKERRVATCPPRLKDWFPPDTEHPADGLYGGELDLYYRDEHEPWLAKQWRQNCRRAQKPGGSTKMNSTIRMQPQRKPRYVPSLRLQALRHVKPKDIRAQIHAVAASGDLEALKFVIKHCQAVQTQSLLLRPRSLTFHDYHRAQPPQTSMAQPYYYRAKLHPRRESPVDLRDKSGNTALLYAALNGHVECVSELINAGADILATNPKNGRTIYAQVNSRLGMNNGNYEFQSQFGHRFSNILVLLREGAGKDQTQTIVSPINDKTKNLNRYRNFDNEPRGDYW